jgi:cytochrome P450
VTEVVDQSLPAFPMTRRCPYAPPAEYQEMREQAALSQVELPSGGKAWVITRHEEVRAMLTDPRFSSDRTDPRFPQLVAGARNRSDFTPSLIGMDPPEHTQARRAVVGEFTVKRMQALQPKIQQIVDEHIDTMLAGPKPVDLVAALALPVPSLVICELLGVPYGDHAFFQQHSGALLRRSSAPEERHTAITALMSYLDELVTAKEQDPGDDLLGRQVLKQRETDTVDHRGLVGLAFLLLLAGHETTSNMISLGTMILLERPEALATINEHPDRTLGAVEELLRYFTIADTVTARLAVEDVEIGGQLVRAGEGVIALGYAANRDPAVFEQPDELDLERGARHHVAFGFGAHQCLGQNLARLELEIVFNTLFRRISGLKLAAPAAELMFKDDSVVYGLVELPVTW